MKEFLKQAWKELDFVRTLKLWISLSIIILLLLITLMAAVRSEDLAAGQCYLFNYTEFNITDNSTASLNQNFCCAEQVINYTQDVYFNLSLDTGEQRIGQQDNCHYDFSCASADCPSESKCIRHRSLDPGDTYQLDEGACDLEFECSEPTNKTCSVDELTQLQVVIEVVKDDKGVTITSLNQTANVPNNFTSFNGQLTVPVQCPVFYDNKTNITTNVDFIEGNCRQWINMFEDRNFFSYQYYGELLKQGYKDSLDFSTGVMAGQEQFRDQLISCMSREVNATKLQSDLTDALQDNRVKMKENESLVWDRGALIVLLIIFAVIMIILLAWVVNLGGFSGGVKSE